MTAWIMLPRVFPRGNICEGRDPLAEGTRKRMQHYPAHVTWPRRLAARVISPPGVVPSGAECDDKEPDFGRELLERAGGWFLNW